MKKEELIQKAYEIAVERYAAVGVDTEQVLKTMQDFHLSLHCWQADDVAGFEVQAGSLTGGIQATGNYPGKARNIDELRADILKAASYIPGTHRLNLHEIYGDFQGKVVDRDQVEPEHFKSWIEWGKEHNMKLDFNSTSFSHPKSATFYICEALLYLPLWSAPPLCLIPPRTLFHRHPLLSAPQSSPYQKLSW